MLNKIRTSLIWKQRLFAYKEIRERFYDNVIIKSIKGKIITIKLALQILTTDVSYSKVKRVTVKSNVILNWYNIIDNTCVII